MASAALHFLHRGGYGMCVIEPKRDAQPLKRRRTEEERRRRHLYGDKGATFSKGKETYIGNDGIANTVTTIHSKDNIIAEIMEQQVKRYRIRKLTPRECFRLMGCDDQTFDKVKASGISDSQLYKMAGNSIVVDVLCGIFTQMFRQDADTLF